MRCPKCHTTNEDGSQCCVSCGQVLAPPATSTHPPEETLPGVDSETQSEKEVQESLKPSVEPTDEEGPYEINFTISPKRVKAEGHYYGIRYAAELETRDKRTVFEALENSIGRKVLNDFTDTSQAFALAFLKHQFTFDDTLHPSEPKKRVPEKAETNAKTIPQKNLETQGGNPALLPQAAHVPPPTSYTPTQYAFVPKTNALLKKLACVSLVLVGGYISLNIYRGYQSRKAKEALVAHTAIVPTDPTDVAVRRIPGTSAIEPLVYEKISHAIQQKFFTPLPPILVRAVVGVGATRNYSLEKMVDFMKALRTHHKKDRFPDYLQSKPDLLINLFSDFPSLEKIHSIEESIKFMTEIFNRRWDSINWSKVSSETIKLFILEAIYDYDSYLGQYMLMKERKFREKSKKDRPEKQLPHPLVLTR